MVVSLRFPDFHDHSNFRGMININGSVMVVDDEYILISSGGVSQGSLSGRRNTELAVGAWQPLHTQVYLLNFISSENEF